MSDFRAELFISAARHFDKAHCYTVVFTSACLHTHFLQQQEPTAQMRAVTGKSQDTITLVKVTLYCQYVVYKRCQNPNELL